MRRSSEAFGLTATVRRIAGSSDCSTSDGNWWRSARRGLGQAVDLRPRDAGQGVGHGEEGHVVLEALLAQQIEAQSGGRGLTGQGLAEDERLLPIDVLRFADQRPDFIAGTRVVVIEEQAVDANARQRRAGPVARCG